jgi:CRISPR system Cascade subunit CasE
LSAAEKAGGIDLDRSEVYAQWLRELLVRQGGAELVDAIVTRYRLLGVTRKTKKDGLGGARQSRIVSGPDVVLTGQLRVTDPQSFAQILSRGVGRHRAFGFGLLLLRSVRG